MILPGLLAQTVNAREHKMYAERNRTLKALMSKAFASCKVTVKGSRGTARGWVTLHIGYAPRNNRELTELRAKVWELIKAAKIQIGTYGYDDPGSDYGHGNTIHINFDRCRETADYWGADAWRHHLSAEQWDAVQSENASAENKS